jgi:hypothetical protein
MLLRDLMLDNIGFVPLLSSKNILVAASFGLKTDFTECIGSVLLPQNYCTFLRMLNDFMNSCSALFSVVFLGLKELGL